jgi:hypothetical protein
MAALAAIPFVGQICTTASEMFATWLTNKNWTQTHQTLAPAVARNVDRVGRAFSQATTNTQRDVASGCSKFLMVGMQLVISGGLYYLVNSLNPTSCKDNPNGIVCTAVGGFQMIAGGSLTVAAVYSAYVLSKAMNSKETVKEAPPREKRQAISQRNNRIKEHTQFNSMLEMELREQEKAIRKQEKSLTSKH